MTLSLTIITARLSPAEENTLIEVGIRLGASAHTEKKGSRSIEVFGTYGLPWSWRTLLNWVLTTGLDGSLGLLIREGDAALFTTLGPIIALCSPGGRFTFDTGGGFALISKKEVGKHLFGGPFQFALHGGVRYKFRWNVVLGYQFYHISDAGIFDGRGLNRHLLELGYYF